jgi:hypothetical protein
MTEDDDYSFFFEAARGIEGFAEWKASALARGVIYRLQRLEAVGLFENYGHRTVWDEYCQAAQLSEGEDPVDDIVTPVVAERVGNLPEPEAILFTMASRWELEGVVEEFDATVVDPAAMAEYVKRVLRKLALARDISRYEPFDEFGKERSFPRRGPTTPGRQFPSRRLQTVWAPPASSGGMGAVVVPAHQSLTKSDYKAALAARINGMVAQEHPKSALQLLRKVRDYEQLSFSEQTLENVGNLMVDFSDHLREKSGMNSVEWPVPASEVVPDGEWDGEPDEEVLEEFLGMLYHEPDWM